jgi:hypothetical protein
MAEEYCGPVPFPDFGPSDGSFLAIVNLFAVGLRGTAMEAKALKKTFRGYGLLGYDVGVGPINFYPH